MLQEKRRPMPLPRVDPIREIFRDRSFANLKSFCSFRNFTPNLLKRRSNKLQFWNLFSATAHRVVNGFFSFLMKEDSFLIKETAAAQ
jgi:hypothetical protein